jgi:hypothetical protein
MRENFPRMNEWAWHDEKFMITTKGKGTFHFLLTKTYEQPLGVTSDTKES